MHLIVGITYHGFVPLLELGAGVVGLALSYAITLMGMFQWGVRQFTELENLVSLTIRVRIEIFYSLMANKLISGYTFASYVSTYHGVGGGWELKHVHGVHKVRTQ